MITMRAISLLAYFTDITIYALRSTLWSSRILWIVGRVIADSSLDLLSPCGVVPHVLILVSNPRVLDK
jgi:hypothetical protein